MRAGSCHLTTSSNRSTLRLPSIRPLATPPRVTFSPHKAPRRKALLTPSRDGRGHVSTIAMERLLDTVLQLKASDLHITVGQPPVIRHQGRMRKLETMPLDQDDTTALMKSITPDRCQ